MERIKKIIAILSIIRLWPHTVFFYFYPEKKLKEDFLAWKAWKSVTYGRLVSFLWLMTYFKEYRNVFYLRIGLWKNMIGWLCPKLSSLYINTPSRCVGGGLKIQHGFSTIITAEKIGRNAHIFQQVTIGYNGNKRPVLCDNVTVCAGAKIIGESLSEIM